MPTRRYRGIIDNELPNRISNFEIAYNLKCTEYNTRIVAPMESFELEKRPKDPLMFYEINDEYFYLIHKWGNDLSLSRAILPLFENPYFSWLFSPLLFSLLFFFSFKIAFVVVIVSFLISSTIQAARWIIDDDYMGYLKPNNWDSEYEF